MLVLLYPNVPEVTLLSLPQQRAKDRQIEPIFKFTYLFSFSSVIYPGVFSFGSLFRRTDRQTENRVREKSFFSSTGCKPESLFRSLIHEY